MSYATVEDMTALWRPMTAAEQARAFSLLDVISASLDVEARKAGKDLPALVAADPALAMVAKSVAVDVAARTLMTSTNQEPMTRPGPFWCPAAACSSKNRSWPGWACAVSGWE